MDAWPGHGDDTTAATVSEEMGKDKTQEKRVEGPWRYPVLHHGTLGAAILQQHGSRYTWSFAAENSPGMCHWNFELCRAERGRRVQTGSCMESCRDISAHALEELVRP